MVMNVGLEAVLSPTIDEGEANREINRIEREVDGLDLDANIDADGLGDGAGAGGDGGVAGALSGRRGVSSAGAAGIGGTVASLGKKALPVALAGTVAFGLLRGIQKLSKASPRLEKNMSMLRKGVEAYARPFGNLIGEAMEPFAKDFMKGGIDFMKTAEEEGLDVAVVRWAAEFPGFGTEEEEGPLNQGTTGGGLIGAGIGTVGGFAIGGPLGGLLGGIAGATIGDIVAQIWAGEFGMDDLEQLSTQSIFSGGLLTPGMQPAVGAGMFVGRSIGEALGVDDFDLGEYIDGLDWTDFVPVIQWARFVGGLVDTVGDALGDLNPIGTAEATAPGDNTDSRDFENDTNDRENENDLEQERREQRERREREERDFEHDVGGDTGQFGTGPFAGAGTGFNPPGEQLTFEDRPDVEERFPGDGGGGGSSDRETKDILRDIRDNTDDTGVGGDSGRRATGPYAEAMDSRPFVEMVEDGRNTYTVGREVRD